MNAISEEYSFGLWRRRYCLRGDFAKKTPLWKTRKCDDNNVKITFAFLLWRRCKWIARTHLHQRGRFMKPVIKACKMEFGDAWSRLSQPNRNLFSPKDYCSGEMQFYLVKRYGFEKSRRLRPQGQRFRWREGKVVSYVSQFDWHKNRSCESSLSRTGIKRMPERCFRAFDANLPKHNGVSKAYRFFRVFPMQKTMSSLSARGSLLLNHSPHSKRQRRIRYVICTSFVTLAEQQPQRIDSGAC